MTSTFDEIAVRHVLQVMDIEECWRKLDTTPVGRFAASVGRQPYVFPVNYSVHDGTLVFRTDDGTKLSAVARAREAAFEIDEVDEEFRIGWSVVVLGKTRELRDRVVIGRLEDELHPWVSGRKAHFVQLVPESITGRRILPIAVPPPRPR